MAGQDLCRFFDDDPDRFTKWFFSRLRRLVSSIRFRFNVPLVDAEEIVDKAFDICRSKPKNDLKHFEHAWQRAARFLAQNRTREAKKLAKAEEEVTARPNKKRNWREGQDISDLRFNPEKEAARSDARAECLAHSTAIKEYLGGQAQEKKGTKEEKVIEDTLKLLTTIIESEGDQTKRSTIILRTGLDEAAYDRARKRLTRAAVHPKVLRRCDQLLIARIFTRVDDGGVRRQGVIPFEMPRTARSRSSDAIREVDSEIREFNRLLLTRKRED